jgi:hypothetical protein
MNDLKESHTQLLQSSHPGLPGSHQTLSFSHRQTLPSPYKQAQPAAPAQTPRKRPVSDLPAKQVPRSHPISVRLKKPISPNNSQVARFTRTNKQASTRPPFSWFGFP